MREESLRLTRRGLLQLVTVIATASFAARRPLVAMTVDPDVEQEESLLHAPSKPTKLEKFLHSHGIKPAHLARESGYSRQHLLRLRMGRIVPSRRCAIAVADACTLLARKRVRARELFDLWLPDDPSEAA